MPDIYQSQNIEQSLQLHLSPRMLAMLKVLQMSYADMLYEVEKTVEENPVLEIERPDTLAEYIKYLSSDKTVKKQVDFTEYPGMGNIKDVSRNLYGHLIDQLKLEDVDEKTYSIAEALIQEIDDSGYLKNYNKTSDELAEAFKASKDEIENILKIIQSFEPEGVGARDLKECLMIQVKEYSFDNFELEEVLNKVIQNHLEDIGSRNYKKAADALNISEEGIIEAANFIKSNLNPNPGSSFGGEVRHVVPSFIVEDGEIVNLEEKYGPKIKISKEYEKMMKSNKIDAETEKFIKNKFAKAKEFIEGLEKRGETIEKMAEAINGAQKEFFTKGAMYLNPLLQKDLARILGVHPSTVSRAICDKYIQTPKGLLPMKFLCPRELSGYSVMKIKAMLKELIEKEDKKKPLRDEEIRTNLVERGIKIERRTVASYRQGLNIPTYNKRRADGR
ncbi:MAG: RNA polymerase sigma-54 factor [Candidatus Saganbacteria bacterium]|uniref:RNA polymerase sigma-54 factor n=1 Tax=Candidatus Saganbacteria bacterium TaxID=2575572 RepID=A0A833KZP9_UNCSA|nr:MAG: RNA polymerase sigma-54 factor [Candidatus Saganbacteria bacterium]